MSPRASLLVFLGALLLTRGLLLLAALEPAEEKVYEVTSAAGILWEHGPERPLYDREELYTGTAAEAMRRDLPIPVSEYQFMTYGGGSLLTAWAARVVYAVFGPSYLSFKLLPLLVTLLGGCFWFLAVRRAFGARVAHAFALLYVLAPSTFVRTVWIAKGDHAEAMAWIGFVLYAAVRSATTSRRERALFAGLAGFTAGLGVFVTYSTVPVLAGVLVGAIVLARGRARAAWLWGLGGCAVGLVPWLIALAASDGAALEIYGRTVGSTAGAAGARLGALVDTGFFARYDLPGGAIPRRIAGLAFLAAVGLGWFRWLRASRPAVAPATPWGRLALAGTAAHLAAFVLAAPDVASRYLVPTYPLLLLAAAAPLMTRPTDGELPDSGLAPRAWALPGTVAALGLFALTASVAQGTWSAARLPLAGTDWRLLGEIVGQKLAPEQIGALPPDVRRHFWIGFGTKVFALVDPEQWDEAAALAGPDERRWIWEGIGCAWVYTPRALTAGPYVAAMESDADRAALLAGMARYAEVLFAPWVVAQPEVDLGEAQRRMAGAWAGALDESRARSVATLAVHGVEVPARAWNGLDATTIRRAAGFASFAGIRGDAVARYPIRDRNLKAIPGDDPDIWRGLAAALGANLEPRTLTEAQRREVVARLAASVPAPLRTEFASIALERSAAGFRD